MPYHPRRELPWEPTGCFAKGQTIPPKNRHHRGEDESPLNPTNQLLNWHPKFPLSHLRAPTGVLREDVRRTEGVSLLRNLFPNHILTHVSIMVHLLRER